MTHISPAAYLVWTMLTFCLCVFFVFHLWSFDRFKSLRWNKGSGTFKRVMVYTYLLSLPLIFIYVFGFTVIKYREGFIDFPPFGIVPKPYILWSNSAKRAIFPLSFIFAVGWAFEMVTHLEEFCFWLFLLNASSIQQNWFQSPYFKTWVVGSIVAVLYLPLISILTRSDPLKNEAYCILAGSLGSFLLTILFLPILWAFPNFLENMKSEGVDTETIVRLTKFSELNTIRVVFRLLFTVSLVILGVDGVRPHLHINENLFATDFLVMNAGIGMAVSSALTLVIFFPRSIEGEIAARDAAQSRKRSRRGNSADFTGIESHVQMSSRQEPLVRESSPVKREYATSLEEYEGGEQPYHHDNREWIDEERETSETPQTLPPLRPNRRNDMEMGSVRLTENNLSKHNVRSANVNPMVFNYTSPIDIGSNSNSAKGVRLTFTRR